MQVFAVTNKASIHQLLRTCELRLCPLEQTGTQTVFNTCLKYWFIRMQTATVITSVIGQASCQATTVAVTVNVLMLLCMIISCTLAPSVTCETGNQLLTS